MEETSFLEQLLNVSNPWRVSDVALDARLGIVRLRIAIADAKSLPCVICGRVCDIVAWDSERSWPCPDICGRKTISYAKLPFVHCAEHGRRAVAPSWTILPDPEKKDRAWLLARHLEVFIPKPQLRAKEQELFVFLDKLLGEATIPFRKNRELEAYPDKVQTLLRSHQYWENLIFGYSTYLTDGYFLGLSERRRDVGRCVREQTMVLKFIITNYRTRVRDHRSRILSTEVELATTPKTDAQASRQTELWCAELHYMDTCDFIVERIASWVLGNESEIWSQEWFTVLNRWKINGERDPIFDSKDIKAERFPKEPDVLCVVDYCV